MPFQTRDEALREWQNGRFGQIATLAPKAVTPPDLGFDDWLNRYCVDTSEAYRPTENRAFRAIKNYQRARLDMIQKRLFASFFTNRDYTKSEHHQMTLREIHQARGELLQWIDLGRDLLGKRHYARVITQIDDDFAFSDMRNDDGQSVSPPAESVTA